jgi:hypothetical protein
MYISNIVIKNFRALDDINCELAPRMNVFVGPNGIGKTTVLQALRLAKALLAPRTQNEAAQALISLGAASPHFPQRMFTQALARDPTRPVEIRSTYRVTDSNIEQVILIRNNIIQGIVLAQSGQQFASPAAMIQYFNSKTGKDAYKIANDDLSKFIERLKQEKSFIIGLTIEAGSGALLVNDPIAGQVLAHIDQSLPPHLTVFSYFPADRALPSGEVQVQLGAIDAVQQVESHNSQPQVKYTRLKNMIFNTIVMGAHERKSFEDEFETIFNGILKGRRLVSLGVNELGLLSVNTQEIESGRVTEIDSLSSGEKNLILTFLLIAKSVSRGGIILFDEPELHLNPAVSRDLLSFMIEEYAIKRDIQFILCTHSPEILTGAFGNEHCSLFHVKSAKNVSKVGPLAIDEYSDALQQLGTSVSEALLYDGTILVEGDDDVEFLQRGFSDLLRRFLIKDRGGRREVEKTAKKIQALEEKGEKVSPIFIIIDRDEALTDLTNSQNVRVLQWKRRCIDNYFIDLDVITELLKNPEIAAKVVATEGEVDRLLREIAFEQLDAVAAKAVYRDYGYLSPSLRTEDVEKGASLEDMGVAFFKRSKAASDSLQGLDERNWKDRFIARTQELRNSLQIEWEAKWKEDCDGKRLFSDLQKRGYLRVALPVFKRRVIQRMREVSSENWRLVESQLKELVIMQPINKG